MIGYIFALLPLYVLVYLPISQMISGPRQNPSSFNFTAATLNSSFIATDDEPVSCAPHNFNSYILSQEPLIIYIEGFLSPEESAHLVKIRSVFVFPHPIFKRYNKKHVTYIYLMAPLQRRQICTLNRVHRDRNIHQYGNSPLGGGIARARQCSAVH